MRGSVTSLESQCILTDDRKNTSIKGLVLCITIGQWMDTIHSRGQNMIKKDIHLHRRQQIHYYILITLHKVFLRPGLHSFSTSQMASQDPALNE